MNKDLFVIWQGVFYYDNAGTFKVAEGTQSVDVCLSLDQYVGQKVHLFLMHQPKFMADGKNMDRAAILSASQSWGFGSCFWGPVGNCPYGHHHKDKQFSLYNQQATGLLEKSSDGVYTVAGEKVHLEYADGHQTVFALFLHEDELEVASSSMGDVVDMQEQLLYFLNVLSGLKQTTDAIS